MSHGNKSDRLFEDFARAINPSERNLDRPGDLLTLRDQAKTVADELAKRQETLLNSSSEPRRITWNKLVEHAMAILQYERRRTLDNVETVFATARVSHDLRQACTQVIAEVALRHSSVVRPAVDTLCSAPLDTKKSEYYQIARTLEALTPREAESLENAFDESPPTLLCLELLDSEIISHRRVGVRVLSRIVETQPDIGSRPAVAEACRSVLRTNDDSVDLGWDVSPLTMTMSILVLSHAGELDNESRSYIDSLLADATETGDMNTVRKVVTALLALYARTPNLSQSSKIANGIKKIVAQRDDSSMIAIAGGIGGVFTPKISVGNTRDDISIGATTYVPKAPESLSGIVSPSSVADDELIVSVLKEALNGSEHYAMQGGAWAISEVVEAGSSLPAGTFLPLLEDRLTVSNPSTAWEVGRAYALLSVAADDQVVKRVRDLVDSIENTERSRKIGKGKVAALYHFIDREKIPNPAAIQSTLEQTAACEETRMIGLLTLRKLAESGVIADFESYVDAVLQWSRADSTLNRNHTIQALNAVQTNSNAFEETAETYLSEMQARALEVVEADRRINDVIDDFLAETTTENLDDLAVLKTIDALVRSDFAIGLDRILETLLATLAQADDDEQKWVCVFTTSSLLKQSTDETLANLETDFESLREAINDEYWRVQSNALEALGYLVQAGYDLIDQPIDTLAPLVDNEHEHVRRSAGWLLVQLIETGEIRPSRCIQNCAKRLVQDEKAGVQRIGCILAGHCAAADSPTNQELVQSIARVALVGPSRIQPDAAKSLEIYAENQPDSVLPVADTIQRSIVEEEFEITDWTHLSASSTGTIVRIEPESEVSKELINVLNILSADQPGAVKERGIRDMMMSNDVSVGVRLGVLNILLNIDSRPASALL